MPKREDIKSILVIGSGPIIIGQACEFDYSGTQACRVLKEEGYRVILANSNPATIMTDPEFAHATYVEPLNLEVLTRIIEAERPDALLPTLGGQTALNLSMELDGAGVLAQYGVELIGANAEAIETAENRASFKKAMIEIGMEVPRSGVAHTMEEARKVVAEIGLPIVIRPAYILGGRGTGTAANDDEFEVVANNGLDASPISEILIEESIAGWKEFELEVMRDAADNQVIICGIENFDPMGVHTGDSITIAPIQTLTDVEYQKLRDDAFACLRRVGVETGGSNVQFATDPETGRVVIIEMNPRVSRSSALASKATGFPIAKIAAKLAVGYLLPEIMNDITGVTPASFEPVIDYVVTKIPRWAFEKFPGTSGKLGTSMQSVGEVMSIGRTFPESLQKACRSLEQGDIGLIAGATDTRFADWSDDDLLVEAAIGKPDRIFKVAALLQRGISVDLINAETKIDAWFLDQMLAITEEAEALGEMSLATIGKVELRRAKRLGFSDPQLANLFGVTEAEVRAKRVEVGVNVTFKTVDTCAGEFEADTPYFYSTYEDTSEVVPSGRESVVILGSGPNRIGQGIEFDYCCVHASFALQAAGYETIMVNCNPETVSTDYDTSDRLYFEPLTYEDVMNVIEAENPVGVIVSLGGQTPLKLADRLPAELVLGTPPDSIDLAEDRNRWSAVCDKLEIPQPPGGTATSVSEAIAIAESIGFPTLVRPSYVLGGRAMEIVYNTEDLTRAMSAMAADGSLGREGGLSAERPVLVDRFLEDATELDVDAVRDATGEVLIGGVMEHVEEAGVHSGDSACVLPPPNMSDATVAQLGAYASEIAEELQVQGLINVQFAVKPGGGDNGEDLIYVIEANPRASRTVPFVAKATGRLLAKIAARVMLGATLAELREEGFSMDNAPQGFWAVKEAVLPFNRFPETDALLGPEMRSTGEVMGIDVSPGLAFVKAQLAAGTELVRADDPDSGTKTVFLSLADRDKPSGLSVAQDLAALGFDFVATAGTASALSEAGIHVGQVLGRIGDDGPTALDLIEDGKIAIVINTPRGRGARADGAYIRQAASRNGLPLLTTVSAAAAAARGLREWKEHDLQVRTLQSVHVSR
jgi:carbamoyl-phosphate synthase large subunit